MPLRALLNEKDFYADELTEAHRQESFLCPVCKERFIIVLPIQNRLKHFRHPKGSKSHYEPETEEHLNGKKVLLNIATKLGFTAKTEVAIGEHVCDVLIEGEQPLALEFQCSKCNAKEISERTETYLRNGYLTLWILGKNFEGDFQKKTRTSIEREIEKIHPTLYYINNEFIVCRSNPDYYEYSHYNYGTIKRRLVEEFDIEWHFSSFVRTKQVNKPALIFRWMIPETPKQEEKPTNDKALPQPKKERTRIEPQQETPEEINQPPRRAPIQRIPFATDNTVHWSVKKIAIVEKCECGKQNSEYQLICTSTRIKIKRCGQCLSKLKTYLDNATWDDS
jgi:competence CoiA-like predicted nuclease